MPDEGCTCQSCGRKYRVDWLVPDDLWERIKPEGKPEGAGMLCGSCIAERVEHLGNFEAIHCAREVNDDGRRAFAWATLIKGRPILRYIKAEPPCNNGELDIGLFGLQLCIGWHIGKPCT